MPGLVQVWSVLTTSTRRWTVSRCWTTTNGRWSPRLTTSGAGVDIVVGRAGSGKTTALAASQQAWRRCRVLGDAVPPCRLGPLSAWKRRRASPRPRCTVSSETSTRAPSCSDPLTSWSSTKPAWWEPASSASSSTEPQRSGPRSCWSAIHGSCPRSKPAGRSPVSSSASGAVELTGNHRQGATWERMALDELRHGNPIWGLAAFELADRVHTAPSMAEARAQLVDAWLEARSAGDDSVMLAANRTDVTALNQLARAELRRSGQLGPDRVDIGGVGLTVGDRVICLRNDSVLSVLNGTQGTVRSITDEEITVKTDQGLRRLPFGYVDGRPSRPRLRHNHPQIPGPHRRPGLRPGHRLTDPGSRIRGHEQGPEGNRPLRPHLGLRGRDRPRSAASRPNPMHGVEKRFLVSRAKGMASDDLPNHLEPIALPRSTPGWIPIRLPLTRRRLRVDRHSVGRPSSRPRLRDRDRYLGPCSVVDRRFSPSVPSTTRWHAPSPPTGPATASRWAGKTGSR